MAQVLDAKPVFSTDLPVFHQGKYHPEKIVPSSSSSPPKPVLIYAPREQGNYPVVLFFHGYNLCNYHYTDLLNLISSHGYIIVAPQLYGLSINPSGCEELESAAEVAGWLESGLPSVLPEYVIADLGKLGLVGHSRGGKTAFTLALGLATTPTPTFSALVGIDPVAGLTKSMPVQPEILTYQPCSFNMSIPVTVIGTGLGPEPKCLWPCAPDGLNHEEFFKECKPPCAHFVAEKYGHMDVLDDDSQLDFLGKICCAFCLNNNGPTRDPMRRCVSGIVVAFLNYYFHDLKKDFLTIVDDPNVAPVKLDEVEFKIQCSV